MKNVNSNESKSPVKEGLNEKAPFDCESTKPAETKYQRPKKAPIPTGGKQGF